MAKQKNNDQQEKVLVQYRFFLWFPLLVSSVAMFSSLAYMKFDLQRWWAWHPFPTVAISLVGQNIVVLIFLASSWLKNRLQGYFLPTAILISTFFPYLGLFLHVQANAGLLVSKGVHVMLPVSIYILISTIFFSWDSKFRTVFLYLSSLVLVESLILLSTPLGVSTISTWIPNLIRKFVIFLLIGRLIHKLVLSERTKQEELEKTNQELRQLNRSLEELTISKERNRLARELHDTLSHHMSGMVIHLEGVNLLWEKQPEKAKEMLQSGIDMTREGLHETRRALKALKATSLEQGSLLEAIETFVRETSSKANLEFELSLPETLSSLTETQEQQIFRIVQESLRNTVKHAEAKKIRYSMSTTAQSLRLELNDDGKGFILEDISFQANFGIQGMKERTQELGGEIEFCSTVHQGTSIQVRIPLQANQAERKSS